MTTSGKWIVVESSDAPMSKALKTAAAQVATEGNPFKVIVCSPPPMMGRQLHVGLETLVVGDRAAQERDGRVVWGRWDESGRRIFLPDGRALDLLGRVVVQGAP